MPDIPRDPRQLARDILAGKVRIEDLAKQRQGGLPPAVPRQQARVPDKIPLPRPAVPRTNPSGQRGMVPVPQRAVQKTVRRQAPPPVVRQPLPPPVQAVPRTAYTLAPQAPSPIAPIGPDAPETMASAMAQKTRPVRKTILLAQLMRGKDALKNGILMAEVLGKPVSERGL